MNKNCCPCAPIPERVRKLMSCSDKLLFTGTYDRTTFYNNNDDTTLVNLSVLPNSVNILNIPFAIFPTFPNSSEILITETYNITSWNRDLNQQYGYISFTNTYPTDTDSDGFTKQIVLQLAVAAKFGNFRSVDKVIIDYTNPVRVIYFLKKEKKC